MTVSKRFYREATQAWLRTAKLEFSKAEGVKRFISQCDRSLWPAITTIYVIWSEASWCSSNPLFVENLSKCTRLQALRVIVKGGLQLSSGKTDFIDDLNERDFKRLQLVTDVVRTSSINSLELVPGEHNHIETLREAAQFRKNLEKLQDYILSQIRARREQNAKAAEQTKAAQPGNSSVLTAQAIQAPNMIFTSPLGCERASVTTSTLKGSSRCVDRISRTMEGGKPFLNLMSSLLRDYDTLESQSFAADVVQPSASRLQKFRLANM